MTAARASRLLIISKGADSMTPAAEAKLRREFEDHLIVPFDPKHDFEKLITPRATVVVAGGDGTVGYVVRKLADSKHPVGIISLGRFNNFARALGLPRGLTGGIRVVKSGRRRSITLGRVNGRVFLEACAVGLFGTTIMLGESAKDMNFGSMVRELRQFIAAKQFKYELGLDIHGHGVARSLVFSNTASIGSNLPVSDTSPVEPYLEFSVHAGASRTDIVGRALAASVLMKHREDVGQVFRFQKLQVTTSPKVRVYADNRAVGRTPATVTAELSAVRVIMPQGAV